MKQEIIDRWIAKLRSGEYTQTNGFLQNTVDRLDRPVGYCCLGVLCEIAVEDGILSKETWDTGSIAYGTEEDFGVGEYQMSFLPSSSAEYFGRNAAAANVDVTNVYFDVTDVQEKLDMQDVSSYDRFGDKIVLSASTLNDHHKFTFNDIADLLEAGKMVENFNIREANVYKS